MSTRSSEKTLAIAAAVALFAACAGEPAIEPRASSVTAPTSVVQPGAAPAMRTVSGIVRSSNVSPVAARIAGDVLRVHVSEGDRVRAGQILVELDAREGRAGADRSRAAAQEIERAIEGARANADLASVTFERIEALEARGSASRQELDDAKARHQSAQSELARTLARRAEVQAQGAQAATLLSYSTVRAPIDGVVTARLVDPGAFAAPGMPLVIVEESRSVRVEATVPEDLPVRVGDRVEIRTNTGPTDGTVTHVQPRVDPVTRSSLVKIAPLSMAGLTSGSAVTVSFTAGTREVIVIPPSAIVRNGSLTSVYVVGADGVVRLRLVTLGRNHEVLSGLAAGERIVTDSSRVSEGVKVS